MASGRVSHVKNGKCNSDELRAVLECVTGRRLYRYGAVCGVWRQGRVGSSRYLYRIFGNYLAVLCYMYYAETRRWHSSFPPPSCDASLSCVFSALFDHDL